MLALGIVSSWTKEAIIKDCILSAINQVDKVVLVHAWGGGDRTEEYAREVAGDKLVVIESPTSVFYEARNFVLKACHKVGADWCLMLDTDERLCPTKIDLRTTVANSEIGLICIQRDNKVHWKEKLFRLPVKGEYRYEIHEEWFHGEPSGKLRDVTFTELEKTTEQLHARSLVDLAGLEKQLAEEPKNHRWIMYKGYVLWILNRNQEAADTFYSILTLEESGLNKAATLMNIAMIHYDTGNYMASLYACTTALLYHNGLSEIPLYAGMACLELKRYQEAITWAELAISNRKYDELDVFRNPLALAGGPEEVILVASELLAKENA